MTDQIIPRFAEEYDVEVEYDVKCCHSPDWYETIDRRLDEGNPPGLYLDTLDSLGKYLARDQLESLDHVLEDIVAANGDPVVETPLRVQDTPYLVPHEIIPTGMFQYRTDVYAELGLSVPETWDELRKNARVIDESDRFDMRGFAVSTSPDTPKTSLDFTTWFYNAGGQYFRWADDAETEVEVGFRTDHVRPSLELLRDLSEFSADTADRDSGSVSREWNGNELGQCLTKSLRATRYALMDDEASGLHSRQALAPKRYTDVTPIDRGDVLARGATSFRGDNRAAATDFLRFMYEGPERQAEMNLVVDPMFGLPPYREVLETEPYRSADRFQGHDGLFLDLQRHVLDEIVPHLGGDRPRTPAALYALEGDAIPEMVNAVVERGRPIDPEIERARRRLEGRLADGQELEVV